MRRIKLRYDDYNQQFNVTERQFGAEDDGPVYLLDDFLKEDFLLATEMDLLDIEDPLE